MKKHQTTVEDDSQECVVNMDHTIKNRFYAQVAVGTPPQILNTVFDTSGYLAYVSRNATCATCTAYDVSASSSAAIIQEQGYGQIDYLDEQSFGNLTFVQDIFNVGGLSPKLEFALNDMIFDGVDMMFGLNLQNQQFLLPPLYYMFQQQLIENLEYSLYYDTNNDTDFGGHLILGGVDETAFSGNLIKMSFPGFDNTMTVIIEKFSINGVVAATDTSAFIESGSNFVGVPLLTFARINQQIKGIVDEEGNYFVDCDTIDSLPDILLTIGGTVFTMTPQNYILRVSQGLTPCMSAFTYLNVDVFNLGQPFLTNVYTYVNLKNQTIGLANLA